MRTDATQLESWIGEERLAATPECLENLPISDETEERELSGEMNGLPRIRDPNED
jgi:hypothetical protein